MNLPIPLPKAGHREHKKARTKQRLIEAALRLFHDRGYDATRIEDIAAKCELVPRTFFRYFCSKDDALLGWYEQMRDDGIAAVRECPRGQGIVSAIVAAFRAAARTIDANARSAEIVNRLCETSPTLALRRAAQRAETQRAVADVAASRLKPADALVAALVTGAVVAALIATHEEWEAGGCRQTLEEFSAPTMRKMVKLLESIDKQYLLH